MRLGKDDLCDQKPYRSIFSIVSLAEWPCNRCVRLKDEVTTQAAMPSAAARNSAISKGFVSITCTSISS
jgi:hypothetical protein